MRLILTDAAIKELKSLDKLAQKRITSALDRLLFFPPTGDIKKLQGYTDSYRLRTGNYRIIFHVDIAKELVTILNIGHRREVYR